MIRKKSVKKVGARTVKSSVPAAKLARKAPVVKKFVAAQQSIYQPFTAPQPVKQAVMSETWKVPVRETPPPAPVVQGPTPVKTPTQEVSGKELYSRIQYHAYLLAEKDGFKADPVHYWVQAERAAKAEIRHPTGA